jgi:beta-galactosidase
MIATKTEKITYIGALLDRELMRRGRIVGPVGGAGFCLRPGADDVEVCRRSGSGGDVFILINYGRQPRTVALPRAMRDVISAGTAVSTVTLPRYGVAVRRPR